MGENDVDEVAIKYMDRLEAQKEAGTTKTKLRRKHGSLLSPMSELWPQEQGESKGNEDLSTTA